MCLPGTIEVVRESRPTVPACAAPRATVTRRAVFAGGGAAALAALLPGEALAHKRRRFKSRGRIVDLTHTFTAGFPVYIGNAPARRTLTNINPEGFYKQEWTFDEHSGTHIDAPGHFAAEGRFTPDLEARELFLPIVVIDIAKRAKSDPDTVVVADDLRRFESRHGRIPTGALVAMDSGWAKKVGDEAAYKGGALGDYHFPGFGDSAIEFLLERRNAAAIGVDTLSLDNGPSTTFSVHVNWLNADNFGVENLANLDKLPPHGATAIVGVIPWQDGSGGPARVFATY
jgi:kynurenine formamidase